MMTFWVPPCLQHRLVPFQRQSIIGLDRLPDNKSDILLSCISAVDYSTSDTCIHTTVSYHLSICHTLDIIRNWV